MSNIKCEYCNGTFPNNEECDLHEKRCSVETDYPACRNDHLKSFTKQEKESYTKYLFNLFKKTGRKIIFGKEN